VRGEWRCATWRREGRKERSGRCSDGSKRVVEWMKRLLYGYVYQSYVHTCDDRVSRVWSAWLVQCPVVLTVPTGARTHTREIRHPIHRCTFEGAMTVGSVRSREEDNMLSRHAIHHHSPLWRRSWNWRVRGIRTSQRRIGGLNVRSTTGAHGRLTNAISVILSSPRSWRRSPERCDAT
jgi:hypothetical protein